MKNLWNSILRFFGFGENPKTARERATELMEWICSQKRLDECSKTAFQAIQKGELKPSDRRAHPYEGGIKSDCIKVDSALTEYYSEEMSKRFGDAKYLLTLLDNGSSTALSSSAPQSVETSIQGRIAQNNPAASKLREDLNRAKHDLHIFKGANGIQSEALTVDIGNSLYVILAFAVFEAIANMFFLRENISTFKALFISLAVAAINVGVNVWFGSKYREKNHIDEKRSKAGKIYKAYAFLLILLLNVFIAWYRFDTQGGVQNSSSEFFLESVVLLIVGIGLGVAAFQKGYALDDPYPDYGPMSRKVDQLEEQWQSLLSQHAEFCDSQKKQALSAHQSIKERILTSQNQLMGVLPELSKLVEQWSAERRHLNHAYSQLQHMFKTTMSTNLPTEFEYPQTVIDLGTNTELEHYQNQVQGLINQKDGMRNSVEALIKEVEFSEQNLNNWIRGEQAEVLLRWPN